MSPAEPCFSCPSDLADTIGFGPCLTALIRTHDQVKGNITPTPINRLPEVRLSRRIAREEEIMLRN